MEEVATRWTSSLTALRMEDCWQVVGKPVASSGLDAEFVLPPRDVCCLEEVTSADVGDWEERSAGDLLL